MIAWEINIRKVENGFVLSWEEELEDRILIGKESIVEDLDTDFSEIETLQRLLWEITEHFGYYGSKHDKKRLCIEIEDQDES